MKLIKIQLFICFLVILVATSSYALFNNDVKKAKEFIEVGMTPQAITLLQKRITDKPTDAEAHFLLATLYVSEGELGNAKQRFKSAVMIDSDYGHKIGEVYKKEGLLAFDQEQYGHADRLLNTAIEYQPNLGKEIGGDYFAAGKVAFSRGDKHTADKLLKKALKFDRPAYAQKVNALYQEYARGLLRTAKNKPKNQRKRYINEASQYLPKSEIDAMFPPPYMKVIFQKQYTGIGYTGGEDGKGGIAVLTNGKNVHYGDRVTIIGEHAQGWIANKYKPAISGKVSFINHMRTNDDVGVRAPKGEDFTVTVTKLTNSY